MELFASDSHYILVDGNESLWISRNEQPNFEARTEDYDEILKAGLCLGTVYGLIGKLHYNDSSESRLVFIQKRANVGQIKGKDLYRICSIITVPLESEVELVLEPCAKCLKRNTATGSATSTAGAGVSSKTKAFTSIEPIQMAGNASSTTNSNNSNSLQKVKIPAAGSKAGSLSFSSLPKKLDRSDKIEDEFLKMFTEAESFFYSTSYDITNTAQRQFTSSENLPQGTELPLWKRADSRFFWNIHLMQDLINSKDPSLDKWILPIIQGYVQHEVCDVSNFEIVGPEISGQIEICVISRRSRFRAGTRYLRRGVDEQGKVANYVETEQIIVFKGHIISFTQVRGSIPVFWSQPGYKYRPPPVLERSDEENFQAFSKHFQEEESIYGPVTIINLVEKGGKEKVLGDAYLNNVLKYNSANINYFAYDFHENCRGMRFENVSKLVDKLQDTLKTMNYCWLDAYGIVLKQEGVCRVNCVDCLDRTNVVQTHISKHMLIVQLSKLGLLTPELSLPNNIKSKLQVLYANNGDTISKQYAGTNALKGDFTRTGERRLAGVMKDGMNSANRYYLNRFKDTSRQAAIDVILGVKTNISDDDLDGEKPPINDEKENTAEQIKQVIDDVKKCIIPTSDIILGSWGLVNTTNEPADSMDIDIIFILTSKCYYVTEYDCVLDALTETQKIPLSCIENIEIGYEPVNTQSSNLWSIFQSSSPKGIPNIRLNYELAGQSSYHQFRSSNIRFFNNVIISSNHSPDEMLEALKMLAEAIESAASISGKRVSIIDVPFLPVKESNRGNTSNSNSSWMHRYFSFGNESEGGEKAIGNDSSIGQNSPQERTPTKFYRRGSLISTPSQGDSGIESVSEFVTSSQNTKKKTKGDGDTLGAGEVTGINEDEIQLSFLKTYEDKFQNNQARTPVEGFRNFLVPAKDLVLNSCGIVSIHENSFSSSLSHLLSAHELIVDVDGLASPVTPTVDSVPFTVHFPNSLHTNQSAHHQQHYAVSPDDHQSPSKQLSPTFASITNGSILSRHRHSLPVNSLTMGIRPITPEITITEEEPSTTTSVNTNANQEIGKVESSLHPSQQSSRIGSMSTKLTVVPKRMTRSSEDVNKIAASPLVPSPLNPHNFVSKLSSTFGPGKGVGIGNFNLKFGRLSPTTVSNDNRSSSDLDLFGSSSNNNMKGSHSENMLRENPFQNQATNRKDLVFAPFNKFAKGMQSIGANLDPRKLKGSLKQPRIDNFKIMSSSKRDEQSKKDLMILQERIKNCNSKIVDV